MNNIFVGGLSLLFKVFRPHWGDNVRNSGLDEGVGVFEVSKYHLVMLTFRFERLLNGRQMERAI